MFTSAFAQAAAEDGIVLSRESFDWLCEQGHVGVERVAKARRDPATWEPVKAALGAARRDLRAPPGRRLGPARVAGEPAASRRARARTDGNRHEVDGPPHFTSFRLAALELYPADAVVGFDVGEHIELCRAWCSRTDGLDRALAAKGFGLGGLPRERAYHDALRDLATPAIGYPPLVRIAAVDGDGAGRLPAPPGVAARAQCFFLRFGSLTSVAETLIVEQRAHLTRTRNVICMLCIDSARTLPHETQT